MEGGVLVEARDTPEMNEWKRETPTVRSQPPCANGSGNDMARRAGASFPGAPAFVDAADQRNAARLLLVRGALRYPHTNGG
jgi:hypothetical protein